MKYVLKPSLERMTLVKIVVTLWNQNDTRALIANLTTVYFSQTDEEWQKIEDKVREKVSQLLLPEPLKEKLLGFVKPIGLQILEWMRYHRRGFYLHVHLPAELYWIPQGTVDRKRTAKVLVKDQNLDIATRYKLACMYCFEDDIQKLWYEMPENLKCSFSHEASSEKANWQSVVFLWTHIMKRRGLGNAHISYKSVFQFCAKVGNKTAAEYFLQKLTPRERKECLVKTAKCAADADVLCFLLSEIDEEQQIEVFKNNPFTVLRSFLKWPLQSFFFKIADRMWDFLSKKHYCYLLEYIINKVNWYTDWNYKKLFEEFWQKSPNVLKSFTADEFDSGCLPSILFNIKDKASLSLILEGVTLIEKKKLIYSANGQNYCRHLILDDQWDLLECFIKCCLPSEDEMIKFKGEFEKQIKESVMPVTFLFVKYHLSHNEHNWNRLFHLSDDSIYKYNKRSLEEGESGSSKRFCT